jgi:hypothetical protein
MDEAMSKAWHRFWFEPWHWADDTWHRRYGAPAPAPAPGHIENPYARRLLFGGWASAFDLPMQWSEPSDARWTHLLAIEPRMLREAAAMLGWVGMLRAPGGVTLLHDAHDDRLLRRALRYRDINCIETTIDLHVRPALSPHACGLNMLRCMAETGWPEIASRIAMMLPPELPSSTCALHIHRIDVARCLTLWGAAARWLSDGAQHKDLS